VGDDSEEVEGRVLPALRELRAELRRRAKLIRELPHEDCPESKVTSELANRKGLEPIVIGIDETQAYFGYGDKKNKAHAAVREEITAIVTDLVKRGPALGFIVLAATQNVCEETIPRQISINAVIRVALKLFDHTTNDQVLGTGAYSRGVDATQFDIDDKGVAFLRADGDQPQIVRSVVGLDVVMAERIAAVARARREAKHRLTGEAAGEDGIDQQVEVDLVADVRDVMNNPPVRRAHLSTILDALQLLRPGIWGHLDVEALGGMLRKAGVFVGQIKIDGRNTSGVRREDLDLRTPPDELDEDAG
jgi:S-DNA-T family DNA segregation ATPase FtsK/SpoIIIE